MIFQFDCFLITTFIVTINYVSSELTADKNLTVSRDDFKSLCEQVGSLLAQGIEVDQVASIVTNQMISKLEPTINDGHLIKGKPGKPSKPSPTSESSSDGMIVYSEGFVNYVVQVMSQMFTVENIMININYAENLNMLVLGKRSTINNLIDETDDHHHHARRQIESTPNQICEQINFPEQLHLDNLGETTKMLRKLTTETNDLISQLFTNSLRKSSSSSS